MCLGAISFFASGDGLSLAILDFGLVGYVAILSIWVACTEFLTLVPYEAV